MDDDWKAPSTYDIGKVFTPGSPIKRSELFSGRLDQIKKMIATIFRSGLHAVIYGERGVGKTSFSNVFSDFVDEIAKNRVRTIRTNCHTTDSFSSLWKRIFQEITVARPSIGFHIGDDSITSLVDDLPKTVSPADVRRVLGILSDDAILVPVFDEFDRISDKKTTQLMADTVKALSDADVDCTVVFIGVGDSVDELIDGHQSIERSLMQIHMPRMSRDELFTIIDEGIKRIHMKIDSDIRNVIVSLSKGLPYVVHLLSLQSVIAAAKRNSQIVNENDLIKGIEDALEMWEYSSKTAYYKATVSQHPRNIFKEVVLACALANTDELGYFTAKDVRVPLIKITHNQSAKCATHLGKLCESQRGEFLQRSPGKKGRYRFKSPLMIPYVTVKGFSDEMVTLQMLKAIRQAQ